MVTLLQMQGSELAAFLAHRHVKRWLQAWLKLFSVPRAFETQKRRSDQRSSFRSNLGAAAAWKMYGKG